MTFTEIQTEVLARLNLTSSDASTRVGRAINLRYHELSAELGIQTSRRTKVSANTTSTSNEVTFSGIEKIEAITDERTEPYTDLDEVTFDELRDMSPEANDSNSPTTFAIKSRTSTTITIALDATATGVYALKAHGLASASDISGSTEPAIPKSYHYILVQAVMADELRKMGKANEAKVHEDAAMRGMSKLRLFLATSNYLELRQGKVPRTRTNSVLE
jgi:hypothetical protein